MDLLGGRATRTCRRLRTVFAAVPRRMRILFNISEPFLSAYAFDLHFIFHISYSWGVGRLLRG